jgi:hypothetical protein
MMSSFVKPDQTKYKTKWAKMSSTYLYYRTRPLVVVAAAVVAQAVQRARFPAAPGFVDFGCSDPMTNRTSRKYCVTPRYCGDDVSIRSERRLFMGRGSGGRQGTRTYRVLHPTHFLQGRHQFQILG